MGEYISEYPIPENMDVDKYRDRLYNPSEVQFPSLPLTQDQAEELGMRFAEDAENMSQEERLESFAALLAALSVDTVRANPSIQWFHASQALIRLADDRDRFENLAETDQKIIARGDGGDLSDKVEEKHSDKDPLSRFQMMVSMWGAAALNRGISYRELHDHLIFIGGGLGQFVEESLH